MISAPRALRAATLVGVVAVAYVGGVVTGVVGSGGEPASPAAVRRTGVIDEAADRISARAARPVDRKALERAAVEGMLRALGDRWSTYYGSSEFTSFQAALQGRYSGVGLWLRTAPAPAGGAPRARGAARLTVGTVEIGSVQEGSPAAGTGVRAGDVVLGVGPVDVTRRDVPAVAALLRGRAGSVVTMTLRRGAATRTVSLTRAAVATDYVTVQRLAGDIRLVTVSAFTRGVGRDVAGALAPGSGVHGARGVVLDLRGDPGGLLDEAVGVASVFLDGGPVVSYDRRGAASRTLDAFEGGDTTTPLVVLVDSGTASAAEVVAAALQDRNRAVVVGARTFGKGTVQEPSTLSDGSALELTVGRYLTPSGRSLEGVGVEPDVLVPPGAAPELAERRALDVLTGLVAAAGGVAGTGRS